MLVDCPPSLNLLTINAMAAAHAVLVPLQCEFFALEGLSQLLKTVDSVREQLNPGLTIHGIVLTMYDSRNNLSGQVVADVREFMGRKVYDTIIPRNVRVSEAPSYGKPVLVYDLKCSGSEAYLRLATEIIQREKQLASAPRDQTNKRDQTNMSNWEYRIVCMTPDSGRGRDGGRSGAEAAGARPRRADRRRWAETSVERPRGQRRLATDSLRPNARNPRRVFAETELDELAASLRQRGIIQPILVRPGAAPPAAMRSSPASGAGVPPSAPACTRFPSSLSRRPMPRRCSSPSSRTCNAPISIRWKRRKAIGR